MIRSLLTQLRRWKLLIRSPHRPALAGREPCLWEAFHQARVGMALLDRDGRFSQVNEALRQTLGYDEAALLSMDLLAVTHPDDRPDSADRLRQCRDGGRRFPDFEQRCLRPDGQIIWGWASLSPVGDDGGRPPCLLFQLVDRTGQKRIEDALWEQILRNELILQAATDGFCVIDRDGHLLESNAAFAAITGYTPAELIDRPIDDLKSDQGEPCLTPYLPIALERGSVRLETRYQRPDGVVIDLSASISLVDTGLDRFFFVSLQNITERRQAEIELRKLSRAVQQSPASVVITDTEGRIEYVNPKFTALTGYSLAEVLGQNPRLLKSGHTPPEVYRQLWDTITAGGEWQGEFCNRKKNGDLYWESASISAIKDSDGRITHYLAVKEDITQRKQVEDRLRESEAQYRSLYTSMSEGMALHQLVYDDAGEASDYRLLEVNPAFEAITGLSRDQVVGRLASEVYGQDEPPYLDIYASVAASGVATAFETYFLPLGKHFNISVFSPAPGQFATVFSDREPGRADHVRQ